jgi:hypothetical protein
MFPKGYNLLNNFSQQTTATAMNSSIEGMVTYGIGYWASVVISCKFFYEKHGVVLFII